MGAHVVKSMNSTEVRDCWENVTSDKTANEEEFREICANVYRQTAPEAYLPQKLIDMWFHELHDHLRVPWIEFYRLYQILVGVCDIRHLEGGVDENYSYALSRLKKFESPLDVHPDFTITLNEGKPSEFLQDLKRDLQDIRFSFRSASVDYATAVGDWGHFRDGLTNAVELGGSIARDIEYCHQTYPSCVPSHGTKRCDNLDALHGLPDNIKHSQLPADSI